MTIRAILFDKDGTLLDFDATFAPATARVLGELSAGDPVLQQRLADAVQFDIPTGCIAPESVLVAGSLDDIAKCLMPLCEAESQTELRERIDALYVKYSLQTLAPFDFLESSLSALEAMGLALGIATNDSENAARAHLDKLELSQRFCFISGCDSGYGEKPEPGMVRAFSRQLDLKPEETMMVGDSSHDCRAGKAAGAVTVGVLSGGRKASDLQPHADHVIADISALPELLNRIAQTT